MIYDCIIAGAGASGLFCGASPDWAASASGAFKGLILEKTKRAGTKLLMSGAGQCNITHSGSIKNFVEKYGKNGSKIRSCLYKYNNIHLQNFLRDNGVATVTREDGKVFPKSMEAGEIRQMLLRKCSEHGFEIRYGEEVTSICRPETAPEQGQTQNPLWQVTTPAGTCLCRSLVIACGGCSYPTTGSDGSIFPILKEDLGLKIVPTGPALTPVFVENYPYAEQSGIAFEQAQLQIWHRSEHNADYQKGAQSTGPVLFTHENFSGPLILNASKAIRPGDKIRLNYLYPSTREKIQKAIRDAKAGSRLSLPNLLAKTLNIPKSFAAAVVTAAGESPKSLAAKLTEDAFLVTKLGGYKKAMATTGGVSLSEISPKTMECKEHPGLYIIGETLDIDGETGGYNLQFAYASARAAANTIYSK